MIKSSLLLFLFPLFFPPVCQAQNFTSPSFHIDWGNFNMTSGKKSSTNYQLSDTVGQNAPGRFDSEGYIVKSGFQYIYDPMYRFSFIISKLNINFGSLTPGVGSTDTNIITITSPGLSGYQVLVSQNHPLQINSSKKIPNTNCDNSTCTSEISSPWVNINTFGFGFNAIGINQSGVTTGIGTSNYFANNTYYRPFADKSALPQETSAIIMSENRPVQKHSARITFKANIASNQTAGNYQNAITFIAVPKY